MKFGLLYDISLWQVALLFGIVVFATLEIGYRIGLRQKAHWKGADLGGGTVILTSMFALLALIIAFTYAAAVNRYDDRKQAAILEANVLSTAFYRADLVAEPSRSELKHAMHNYALTRVVELGKEYTPEERDQFLNKTLSAKAKLWPLVNQIVQESKPTPVISLLVTSINKLFDMHASRLAATTDKLPLAVTLMLLFVAAAALGVAGFNAGISGRISRWRISAYALVLILVMIVIQDFDRPAEGFILIPQDALNNLLIEMETHLS